MKNFINSLKKKEICNGHTMSMVNYKNYLLVYKGEVDFEGITLFKGNNINSLKPIKQILKNRRWAVVIVDDDKIQLFCTCYTYKPDVFKYQNIYRYESRDGQTFSEKEIIVKGSAPWIWKYNNNYYLYYHRETEYTHEILVKISKKITELQSSVEHKVLSINIGNGKEVISAPSVVEINGYFFMLCEHRKGNKEAWKTVLFKSENPLGPFNNCGVVLPKWCACAFHYKFDNKYILTYSARRSKKWKNYLRKGYLK